MEWYQEFNIPEWVKPILTKLQSQKIILTKEIKNQKDDIWLSNVKAYEYLSARSNYKSDTTISVFARDYKDYHFVKKINNKRHINISYLERLQFVKNLITELNTRNYYMLTEYENGLDLHYNEMIKKLVKLQGIRFSWNEYIKWDNFFRSYCFLPENQLLKIKFSEYKRDFYRFSTTILRDEGYEFEF